MPPGYIPPNRNAAFALPVPVLDRALNAVASLMGKYTRIAGAGAFLHDDGHSFFEAWKDEESEGSPFGAYNLRLGRLELTVDYRITKAS